RLGNHRGDVKPLAQQGAEGRHREVRGAEKDGPHAQSELEAGAFSGISRMTLGSSFRRDFHLRISRRRLSGLVRSKKMIPSRWSISCWIARALSSVALT